MTKLSGTRPDGRVVSVFACGKCGTVLPSEEQALVCCKPHNCVICGVEMPPPCTYQCEACSAKVRVKDEQRQYVEAAKVPYEKYRSVCDWLYDDRSDRFFEDKDGLDNYYHGEAEKPEWVWGCTEEKFGMNACDIVNRELESAEWFEDAYDQTSEADLSELQKALDKVAAGVPPCYRVDYRTVVLLAEPSNT